VARLRLRMLRLSRVITRCRVMNKAVAGAETRLRCCICDDCSRMSVGSVAMCYCYTLYSRYCVLPLLLFSFSFLGPWTAKNCIMILTKQCSM
jgi:hypothetical protein